METSKTFGGYFKELRMKTGKTLRQFCLDHQLDPGNISRIERGKAMPPQDDNKLVEWAGLLGLRKGSPEWTEFFELAAIDAGRIPQEILSNKELVAKLPLVFRTLKGEKLSPEKLRALIETIRKS